MEAEKFLFFIPNGNNGNYAYASAYPQECVVTFKTNTIGGMSDFLAQNQIIDLTKKFITTDRLPCDDCQKEKCKRKESYQLIDSETLQEIIEMTFAEKKEEEGIGEEIFFPEEFI